MTRERLTQMLEARTEKNTGCWLWRGHVNVGGYGKLRVGDKLVSAHRIAVEIRAGTTLGRKDIVHHLCRNKRCVRPEHLQVLTPSAHAHLHEPSRTSCKRGHDLALNRYVLPSGRVQCAVCISLRSGWQTEKRRRAWVAPAPRACVECGQTFAPKRIRAARYCNRKCAQAAWNHRQTLAKRGEFWELPA